MFLHENPVAFANLPLEELNQQWLKKLWPVLKKSSNKNVAVENYLKDNKSKALFFNEFDFLTKNAILCSRVKTQLLGNSLHLADQYIACDAIFS